MMKVDKISGRRIVILFAAIISGFILTGQIYAQASSEKQLTAFQFASIPGAVGSIDQDAYTVDVTVPFSQDLSALVATFTLSPLATAKVGSVIQVSGTTANGYSSTVTFKVIAENGSTRNYYITVHKAAASTDKQLLTFKFEDLDPDVVGVIDQTLFTVTLTVPFDVNIADLVAYFTSSALSTVEVADVIQTSGSTHNNFTGTVDYSVIDENGDPQVYEVTVTRAAASTAADILSYKLTYSGDEVPGVIVGTTITATIPYAWEIKNLIAIFELSEFASADIGGTAQVSGVTINDFTGDLVYVVTAQDDNVTKNYTVTVTQTAASQAMDMLTFDFKAADNTELDVDVSGNIDNGVAKTITLEVPYGTAVTSLIPRFTHSPLSTVTVGTSAQVSGTTSQNFTNPVAYNVTAENDSNEIYTVTVTEADASQENELITFEFAGIAGAVGVVDQGAKTVTVHVPFATNLTSLVATFTVSNFAVTKVGTVVQQSGVTPNNFTNSVIYSIISQDISTELYTVTVIIDSNTEKKFISFSFQQISPIAGGEFDHINHTIVVQVANSIDRSALVASFAVSTNATVKIAATAQVSGVTANDFTSVLTYTVIAGDGSTQDYQVTVTNLAVQTGKQITTFSFNALDPDVVATIDQDALTIDLTVPLGTNVTALVATFSNSLLSDVTIGGTAQTSGTTANDFTNPVSYVVTAEDGGTQAYTVTVTITAASSENEMTYFAFEGFSPDIIGVVNQASQTVSLTLPNGTDRTALVATFTTSALTTVRIQNLGIQQSGLTVNDYTNPMTYEVYAQDGTQKNYVVTVYETNDVTAPIVTVVTTDGNNTNANQVTNELGQFALLRSNEASGKVYIIEEDAPQTTVADLEASVAAGKGRTAWVQLANTNIPISTYAMDEGTYYAYAIDAASNMSAKSTIAITIDDELAPTVIIAAQTISNASNNSVVAQSSENEGFIYLIKDDVPQTTKGQLDAAVAAKNGVKGFVFAAFTNITLPVAGLNPGNYHAYAVDNNSNLSDASSQIVVITAASRLKSMSSYSFQGTSPASIGHIAGTLIDVEVPYGTSLTALVASFTISEKATAYIGLVEQISGVTANNFTNPVTYTVEAEDGTTLDYVMTVTVASGTGINDIQWVDAIQVYPNPVQDQFSIEMLKPVDRVIVIDLLGQIVADIDKPGTDLIQISTQSWTPGLFIVRFYRQGETVYHSKLIKK